MKKTIPSLSPSQGSRTRSVAKALGPLLLLALSPPVTAGPAPLEIELPVGSKPQLTRIALAGQPEEDLEAELVFQVSWAEVPRDGKVAFELSDARGKKLSESDLRSLRFRPDAPSPLYLKVSLRPGTVPGQMEQARLRLDRLRSRYMDPIEIPVRVRTVRAPASAWTRAAAVLVVPLSLFYGFFLWRNSHFIKPDKLAPLLIPMLWTGGTPEPPRGRELKAQQASILRMIERELKPLKRVIRWLLENPIVFGCPGQQYNETLELRLASSKEIGQSQATLVGFRNAFRRFQYRKRRPEGRLFVSARADGFELIALPGSQGRVGDLYVDKYQKKDRGGSAGTSSRVFSAGGKLVKRTEEKIEGGFAGWRLSTRLRLISDDSPARG